MADSRAYPEAGALALPEGDDAREHVVSVTLTRPESRIRVANASGRLGGATAEFEDGEQLRRWDAKHAWDEGSGDARARVFEFDEPLPAREIRLRIRAR